MLFAYLLFQLIIHMDILEENLKNSFTGSSTHLSDTELQVKTQDFNRMTSEHLEVENKGSKFLSHAAEVCCKCYDTV